MIVKEIEIIEVLYHEVFEMRQEATCDEDREFYQGQMDILDDLELRLGVDSSAYWRGEYDNN